MAKSKTEIFRSDDLTVQLLAALQGRTDRTKSDLIRSAIYYLAQYEFGEEFPEVLVHAKEYEELVK